MRIILLFVLCFVVPQASSHWNCAWPFKLAVTIEEQSGNDLINYEVSIDLDVSILNNLYVWSDSGLDIRLLDSDDESPLEVWIETWNASSKKAKIWVRLPQLLANETKVIYLYYGNEAPDPILNTAFELTLPGINLHSRLSSINPSSKSHALNLFEASTDINLGYGCDLLTTYTNISHSTLFGEDKNSIIHSESYFQVLPGEEGLWTFRLGSSFGNGGGLYINGVALEENWVDDLTWGGDWNNSAVLQGSITLSAGYHKLQVIGSDNCCDSASSLQFKKPTGSWLAYANVNLDITSNGCPIIAPNISIGLATDFPVLTCPVKKALIDLDNTSWQVVNNVLDLTGNIVGSITGSVEPILEGAMCAAAKIDADNLLLNGGIISSALDVDADIGNIGNISFWLKLDDEWNNGEDRILFDASRNLLGLLGWKVFYLLKRADGLLEFHFEDDDDNEFTIVEVSQNRQSNTWYLISVNYDYVNNNFSIYIGDTLVASGNPVTSGTIANLGLLTFGHNMQLINLGALIGANFKDISYDEISISANVLDATEIRSLLTETRDCLIPEENYCIGTFPDGLGATGINGVINFGLNAQLINNTGLSLNASVVNTDVNSSVPSCSFDDCSSSGTLINRLTSVLFPAIGIGIDISLSLFQFNLDLGLTVNLFNNVVLKSSATLNFLNTLFSDFEINHLELKSNSTLNLSAGNYWINDLTIGNDVTINVTSGPVRIYVGGNVSIGNDLIINSPSQFNTGLSENLFIYFYNDVVFGADATISGVIYSESDVTLSSGSHLFGLLTAANISLGANAKVILDVDAYGGLGDIMWCETNSVNISKIEIVTAQTAINCLPTLVELSIYDANDQIIEDYVGNITLSTSTNHGDWSLDASANGVLTPGPVDTGAATYNMVVSDKGKVKLYLHNIHAEETELRVESLTINNAKPVSFEKAGFVFKNNGVIDNIPNQIAAKFSHVAPNGSSLSVEAVDTATDGSCQGLLQGNQTVKFAIECIAPANCSGSSATIAGVNMVSTNATNNGSGLNYVDVTLDFSDSSTSEAPFNLSYIESGLVRLYAYYELLNSAGTATGDVLETASNSFLSQPYGFCVEPVDADWQCDTPGLSNACTQFKQAGEAFDIEISAKRWNNSGSSNFCDVGYVTSFNYSGSVDLSANLVSPAAGTLGNFAPASANLVDGDVTLSSSYSEMGTMSISVDGNTGLTASTSENIGRFFPKDFFEQSNIVPVFDNANTSFTYTGQITAGNEGAIHYDVLPSINFIARGFNNQLLENYIAPFSSNFDLTVTASSAVIGSLGAAVTVTAGFNDGSFSGPNADSEYIYEFSNDDHFVYDRNLNSLIDQFDNDITLTISNLEDADGVSLSNTPVELNGSGGPILYGRIRIENAYGPEDIDLLQKAKAEYYDGSNFVINIMDSSTTYDVANIGAKTVINEGDVGNAFTDADTTASGDGGDTGNLAGGVFSFIWSAPTPKYGSFKYPYSVPVYLKFDWEGAGDDDPNPEVSFGQYRGHDKMIYWKEIIR
ncbi:MAG: CCXG family PEP-CTERM protein [Bermanella sp.]